MTNKEAAAKLGVSVSTARRWRCGWCGQNYLAIAQGQCSAIYERCNTEDLVKGFRKAREDDHDFKPRTANIPPCVGHAFNQGDDSDEREQEQPSQEAGSAASQQASGTQGEDERDPT